MPCLLAQKERLLASPKLVADGQRGAPLPLILRRGNPRIRRRERTKERTRKGRNVHYFSAASHDRFLARRQTKIPPRKPRTELGFRQSTSPKAHFWNNTSCSACPARQSAFCMESPLDLESVLPKFTCRRWPKGVPYCRDRLKSVHQVW